MIAPMRPLLNRTGVRPWYEEALWLSTGSGVARSIVAKVFGAIG
jgi:hypothetical protein